MRDTWAAPSTTNFSSPNDSHTIDHNRWVIYQDWCRIGKISTVQINAELASSHVSSISINSPGSWHRLKFWPYLLVAGPHSRFFPPWPITTICHVYGQHWAKYETISGATRRIGGHQSHLTSKAPQLDNRDGFACGPHFGWWSWNITNRSLSCPNGSRRFSPLNRVGFDPDGNEWPKSQQIRQSYPSNRPSDQIHIHR